MVASVVFILLLDHLPEHLHNLSFPFDDYNYQEPITEQQCRVDIADPLVQIASEKLNVYFRPYWRNDVELTRNFTQNFYSEDKDKNAFERFASNEMEGFSSIENAQLIQNGILLPPQFEPDSESDKQLLKLQNSKEIITNNNLTLKNTINSNTEESLAFDNTKNLSTEDNLKLFNTKNISISENQALDKKTNKNSSTEDTLALDSTNNFQNLALDDTKNLNPQETLSLDHNKNLSTPEHFSLDTKSLSSKSNSNNSNENNRESNIDTAVNNNRRDNYVETNKLDDFNDVNSKKQSIIPNADDINNTSVDTFTNLHSYENKTENENYITINTDLNNQNKNITNIATAVENYTNTLKDSSTKESPVEIESSRKAVSFPKSVPYLVAIFETLDNVTAQTCSGTLVAPEWVLTVVSCVNVLGNLYNNSASKDRPSYTVIVNATNPLIDGSAHNVTEIILHPHHLSPPLQSSEAVGTAKPTLALMRIEPKVAIDEVKIGVINEGDEVVVYGWALAKNKNGHDELRATMSRAVTLSPLQCSQLGHSDSNEICLTAVEDTYSTDNQMRSGAPIVGLSAEGPRLMALASSDSSAPILAAPLAKHARWLGAVLCA